MIEPYYQDPFVTLYNADNADLMAELAGQFDCIVTDPPYGIDIKTNGLTKGRSTSFAPAQDFAPVHGDDQPFDPMPWVDYGVPTILFGGNHYGSRLPDSPSWIVWDKLDGLKTSKRDVGFNNSADVELAWTNLGGPARLYGQRWQGMNKSGEDQWTKRRHPTEKPVELMRWCINRTEGVILDPYVGAGSTLRAAKDLGREIIGIEISAAYCEIAANRCRQECLPFA